MLKLPVILACALVGLTGCETPPRRSAKGDQPPPDWGVTATNPPPRQAIVTNAPPPPPPPKPIVAATTEPKTNPPPPSPPEATWVSVERWAREQGLEGWRRVTVPVVGQASRLSSGRLAPRATNAGETPDATGETPAPLPEQLRRRGAAVPLPGFELPTRQGTLALRPGSLTARWNGVEFRLGFAPRWQDDQLLVHALDLRKNLQPLLRADAPPDGAGKVIVLDPGHGGSDPGTQSAEGRTEKNLTLDWALRTARLLEEKGWRVWLTRTNDIDVPRPERVALAEAQHADLFLSLHFNSAGGNGGEGLETYCLTPVGMASSLTRGYDDNPAQSFPNNAFDEQNFRLALAVHRALLKATGQVDRGVRRARFPTVLQGQNRPAILIEGGYLSNPSEARRIGAAAFRQRLAEAVAEAIGRNSGGGVQTSAFNGPPTSAGNSNGR